MASPDRHDRTWLSLQEKRDIEERVKHLIQTSPDDPELMQVKPQLYERLFDELVFERVSRHDQETG